MAHRQQKRPRGDERPAGGRPRSFSDEDLVLTARRCFLEHGPGVSTALIAEELGVSQAALFKRCGTKRELMMKALAPPARPEWIMRVLEGPDERPVRDQLQEIAAGMDAFFAKLMPRIAILAASGIGPKQIFAKLPLPPPVMAHRGLTAWFDKLIQHGRVRGASAPAIAGAFMGAVHGRQTMRFALGDQAPDSGDDYLEQLVDIFWRGIAPPDED